MAFQRGIQAVSEKQSAGRRRAWPRNCVACAFARFGYAQSRPLALRWKSFHGAIASSCDTS
jgi:hypothetical protein